MSLFSPQFIQSANNAPHLHKIYLNWKISFLRKAHSFQIIPSHLDWWDVWLLLAGRGSGKTYCASTSTGLFAWENPKSRILVLAPTANDLRATCFEGDSGLCNTIPKELQSSYNKSTHELELKNGSLIRGISGDSYERIRGFNGHFCWIDELCAFQYGRESWDVMRFALRLGSKPRVIISTTPKPSELITELFNKKDKTTYLATASSYANLANLAPSFAEQIRQYEGTQLGRQEIHAEILSPDESGVIKLKWIRGWDHEAPLPQLSFCVYSLDTAFTEKSYDKKNGRDFTACTIWGVFFDVLQQCNGVILLDCWFDQIGLPQLIDRVKKERKQMWGQNVHTTYVQPRVGRAMETKSGGRIADVILIEDIGSGMGARQMLASEGIKTFGYNPAGDSKIGRLHQASVAFASGLVYFPTQGGVFKSWTTELLKQLTQFSGEGSLKNDDGVDSTSQAINLLLNHNKIGVHVIHLEEDRKNSHKPITKTHNFYS